MLKLAYKVGSRGGAMVSTSARNAGDPWFESRSWYDRFLYVNIHLFIYIYIYIYIGIKSSTVQKTSSTKRFRLSPSSEFIQVKNQSFNICTYKAHESRKNKKTHGHCIKIDTNY